ncbi:MAG: 16S rRNA (adenine(1518)-N(6)/adenine(1519)-N(6)) -dimethyltransferase RsmA [Anaerolineales bacterium]
MADSMNLPPLRIAEILWRYGLRPDRQLGQNFLVDEAALRRVTFAAEITPIDAVLEIGPGLGSLTRHLALAAQRVVAVELDERLLPALRETLQGASNVEIVAGDILQVDPAALMAQDSYLVVANIPYYITSAVFRHLLAVRPRPRRIVLTVQREVAQRICAAPGEMNLLALGVQLYGEPSVAAHIPAGAFLPVPKVDSAVVRVDVTPQPRLAQQDVPLFFQLAKAAFAQKRKTLANTLSAGLRWSKAEAQARLAAAGIAPNTRPQALDWDAWARLVAVCKADGALNGRL